MIASKISRRSALAGLACLSAGAGRAAEPRFASAMDTARAAKPLHALIIAQDGEIVSSEAFRGPALDRTINIKSVSKSVISALVGIALQNGEIASLDTKVAPLIARFVPRRADRRVRDITVRHMLTMQSGLQEVSGAAYGDWVGSRFWIYEALSKPMVADPGSAMLYSTASYHVLGAVLTSVTGQDLHALATTRLGQPLGIQVPPWTQDPQGRYLGGNDMRLSPLALLKFGELYRRGGRHLDARILSDDWVTESWTPVGASRQTGHGYGFGWFIWEPDGIRIAYARGYGGQMIFVVPEKRMTVVATSSLANPARLDGHLGWLYRLMTDHILPNA